MEENNSPFILDRTTYKRIKSMDRKHMEACLTDIYNSGVKDATNGEITAEVTSENNAAAAAGVTPEAIREAISGVKGIGEARLNDIMDAVSKLF